MKIIEYLSIRGYSLHYLDSDINTELRNGWVLWGSMLSKSDGEFIQPMVKFERETHEILIDTVLNSQLEGNKCIKQMVENKFELNGKPFNLNDDELACVNI